MFFTEIIIGRRAVKLSDLHYHVLPGKYGNQIDSENYVKMHDFWKQQWEPVVRAKGKIQSLDSDEFLRQFEITAIFYEGKVIGLLCLDLLNLNSVIDLNHSYFSWLNEQDRGVFKDFGFCFIINQLAVSKMWRGELGIADLLCGLAVKRIYRSSFQRAISLTRNHRKTNSIAERWGARPILMDQMVHNEPSTCFEIPKNCFSETNHLLKPEVEFLWTQAIKQKNIVLNDRIIIKNLKKGELYDYETEADL